MDSFTNQQGVSVVDAIIEVVQKNRAYLSEIDGAIGDGDHGVNMSKGVTLAKDRMADTPAMDLTNGLKIISDTMIDDIGGSMGPLYGTFFRQMFRVVRDKDNIDAEIFQEMLNKALDSIKNIGNAQVGDKTLIDTLEPAVAAYTEALQKGSNFVSALEALKDAADKGKESTIDMVARVGRSSRLGERSRGVLDAGATSCWLILTAMADAIILMLK